MNLKVARTPSPIGRSAVADQIRVAVLGCWHVHARDYAGAAHWHPQTELMAVWDDHEARGRAGAAEFGVPYVDDLDALLARADIDAVTVTSSTDQHRDLMLRAAAAGKHIFSEKVLAPTVAEAEEIISACDTHGVALTVSLPRLYHGYTQALVELIDSGRLGELTYSRVRLSHDGATAGWLPERFYDPATAIGGALTDLGCHPVYLNQLFLGARPASVSATYGHLTGRALEDQAVVTLGYPSGAIGVAETGFVSNDGFAVEVHGTAASAFYSRPGDGLRIRAAGAAEWEAVPIPEDGEDAFAQWVRHIRQASRADDNIARAVELTRLVAAANESSARGRVVLL